MPQNCSNYGIGGAVVSENQLKVTSPLLCWMALLKYSHQLSPERHGQKARELPTAVDPSLRTKSKFEECTHH